MPALPMLVLALIVVLRRSRRQHGWPKIRPRRIVLTVMMVVAIGPGAGTRCFSQQFGQSANEQESPRPSPTGALQLDDPADEQQLLREGMLIPPTVGRIIPIGRRWGFAPDNPELISATMLKTTDVAIDITATGLRHKPRPSRLGAATIMVTGPNLPRVATSVRELPTEKEQQLGEEVKVQHLILTENLMLQRIVEAITSDSSDNRWTISGEITEFRNQNRLMIRTAQRANAN